MTEEFGGRGAGRNLPFQAQMHSHQYSATSQPPQVQVQPQYPVYATQMVYQPTAAFAQAQYPPIATTAAWEQYPMVKQQQYVQPQYHQVPFASYAVQTNVQMTQATPVPIFYNNPEPTATYVYSQPPTSSYAVAQDISSAIAVGFDSPSRDDNVFLVRPSTKPTAAIPTKASVSPSPPPIAPPRFAQEEEEDDDDDDEEDGSDTGKVIQPLDPAVSAANQQAYMSRPHVCEFCSKRFQKLKHLKRHLEVHSESKRFECSDCGKKFRRRDNLVSHSRIHTGETPYACPICDKKFRHQSACINHRRTHYDTKSFQCHLCLLSFSRKSSLKRHIQGIHKDQMDLTSTSTVETTPTSEAKKDESSVDQ
jgi:uncharacterized Zn-finger protein